MSSIFHFLSLLFHLLLFLFLSSSVYFCVSLVNGIANICCWFFFTCVLLRFFSFLDSYNKFPAFSLSVFFVTQNDLFEKDDGVELSRQNDLANSSSNLSFYPGCRWTRSRPSSFAGKHKFWFCACFELVSGAVCAEVRTVLISRCGCFHSSLFLSFLSTDTFICFICFCLFHLFLSSRSYVDVSVFLILRFCLFFHLCILFSWSFVSVF